MKKIFITLISIVLFSNLSAAHPPLKVGIILPVEHQALNEIVTGFQEQLRHQYPGPITFFVENAQGDINIQQAIINKIKRQDMDLIVPVTTGTAQMTAKSIKKTPVISLAAMYSEEDRTARAPVNLTGILDEVPVDIPLVFLKQLKPGLKKITLVYSSTDKITEQAKQVLAAAKKIGISVQPLMFQTLSDLYTLSKSIAKDSEAVFILKDNIAANGITTLIHIAQKRGILLITSDEGTVKEGALMGVGVQEKDIGVEGANIALKVLRGTDIKDIPLQQMHALKVFLNSDAALTQGINPKDIKESAQRLGYPVILFKGKSHV